MTASSDQTNGRHTIIHQFACQFARGHARVTDGEVESVGHRSVEVLVIDHVEVVAAEDVFQLASAVAIDFDIVAETVFTVACGAEHLSQGVLSRVAGAAAQRIEHACGEDQTEGQSLVACRQVGIVAVEQLVADTCHSDALACITEGFGSADEQDIVVGVAGDGGLIGWFKRCAQVLAEVHGEVGEVFHHDGVVAGGQLSDGLQLAFCQANPGWVVGVGIDDGADVAFRQVTLQLRAELIAAEVVHIEGLVANALHLQLHLLNGKTWVDEEHCVFLLVGLRTSEERGEGALHAAANGHTTLRCDIHTDEGLDKTRSLPLEFGVALDVGVGVCDASLKGFHLRIHTHLGGRKSRNTHFHLDKLHAALLFGGGGHLFHFADGGFGEVLNAELLNQSIHNFSFDWCWFHILCFVVIASIVLWIIVFLSNPNSQQSYDILGEKQNF